MKKMLQGYDWVKGVHVFAFRMVLSGLQNALSVWSPPPLVNIHRYMYMCIYICMYVISFMNIFLFLRLGFSSLLSPPDGTMKQKRKLL